MAVPYYALMALGAVLLRLLAGAFEHASAPPEMPPARVPFAPAERRTLAILTLTALLWLTDAVHHLSPAIPAIIGATLLLLPGTGVLDWKSFEQRLSWGLILTVGTSLSLAALMTRSGAAAWLGQLFTAHLSSLAAAPLVLIVAMVLAAVVVHLAITNLAACIALLLPINATIAESAGINPVVTGLILTMVVDAVILYPVQTAANLMAYESGYFDLADVLKLGLGMLGLSLLVALLVLPYWAMLGLPLTAR
jgi:sodium-dependent dicarboxylate transporter 2/3/5